MTAAAGHVSERKRARNGHASERFADLVHHVIERGPRACSELEAVRRKYLPIVPPLLCGKVEKRLDAEPTTCVANADEIARRFPRLYGQPVVHLEPASVVGSAADRMPLRVGCVLSGGQAAGGHNCIVGLFDFLRDHHPGSTLYGFKGGPKGVMTGEHFVLDAETVDLYRNSGGFTMLSSGRDKIESEEQFQMAVQTAKTHQLDGLIVIGGDDSNTNACVLAECYAEEGLSTRVVGLPKTIDGDLKNEHVEVSFGFDTAAKLYAEMVGNIMVDCTSSRKYYHFVRLMGREASHLTLEVALRTHPNLVFVGEEVKKLGLTLGQITAQAADMVAERAKAGMDYGVVLIPEGLIDFIPEVGALISELNDLLAKKDETPVSVALSAEAFVIQHMSPASHAVFALLPEAIRLQLLLDRDPHGNVQVAKIESERLLGELVARELQARAAAAAYTGKFAVQYHYFGYEGRCPPPTNFDSNYCYGLGLTAGALISSGSTGVMACLKGLTKPPAEWTAHGVPLTAMLAVERRKGKDKPVIRKALVELDGAPFAALAARRAGWRLAPSFVQPGPVQFDGPTAGEITLTLQLEQDKVAGLPLPAESTVAPLTAHRTSSPPEVPAVLSAEGPLGVVYGASPGAMADTLFVASQLTETYGQERIEIVPASTPEARPIAFTGAGGKPLNVGLVFCGRQCPGAHNVAAGLVDLLAQRGGGQVFGFVNGTRGLFSCQAKPLTAADVSPFLNCGGMALLGRSADVIRTPDQFAQAEASCAKLGLDGLVLIGGPVTNSDTALLAEYFAKNKSATKVIGVPATIDGDLYSNAVEASIGFDTACKVYSSLVGNLATDAASARKYFYFVRIMGRSPSHITLECANLTQPNMALIGEELEARRMTLAEIVAEIADMVAERAAAGKHYGVVLIPEGLLEYVPQVNALFKEIAAARRLGASCHETVSKMLTPYSAALLDSMPAFIQAQLMLEQQASDDKAQLSQIETERLLAELVRMELDRRAAGGGATAAIPDVKFSPICFYLGYQARSSMPSLFDSDLGYALGQTAGTLIAAGATAYMATAHCLAAPTADWRLCGVPLSSMMAADRRAGQAVAVVRPAQVSLHSPAFARWVLIRERLKLSDHYCNPGPLQLAGALACGPTQGRLRAEHASRADSLDEVQDILHQVGSTCWAGVSGDALRMVLASMRALRENLSVLAERDALAMTNPLTNHARMTQLDGEQMARRDN